MRIAPRATMERLRRLKCWLCSHNIRRERTWLIGGPDSHVMTEATCMACGQKVPPHPSRLSYNEVVGLLDRAKALPTGARERA